MNKEMELLIEEVKAAAQAYYQGETPIMTDDEYDIKVEYIKQAIEKGEIELTEELQELIYDSVSAGSIPEGEVVVHDYPMLSLAKAKNSDELEVYHKRLTKAGAKGFRLEMKFDGLALSAKYSGGKLIQLATRGDGVNGELLNYLIDNKHVSIVGLPKDVGSDIEFELRGELYMTDEQFDKVKTAREKATGEVFSNSRNAATGIVKRSKRDMDYSAELTFTAYSAYKDGNQISFDSLGNINGISIAKDVTENEIKLLSNDEYSLKSSIVKSTDFDKLKNAVEIFGKLREGFSVPTDGVVIKPTNEIEMLNKMGFTSHHPIAYIAYKYPGEKAITEVLDIVITVGKTGRLTPQARVTPVEVDGVVISNITCHNFNWLNEMGIKVGSKVAVTRANDVIPAIDSVVVPGDGDVIVPPKTCPECGEALEGDGTAYPKTLTCENLECPSRLLFYIKSIVGRNYLYIEGLGNVALEALVEQGIIKSIVDLFRIKEDELANVVIGETSSGGVRKIGPGNAKNIMKSIERAKNNTDSNKLLASLNIDGMGPNTAKKLIDHFGGIEQVLKVDPERIGDVPQVGPSLIQSFHKHQKRALEQFNELVELGFKVNDPVKKANVEKKGTFSVSGPVEGFANRNEFVRYMEAKGWEFHRVPKKDTDVLFADPNGTSSKIKKARANGTRIVASIDDL